jgi:uncharacterized protein YajQ (UPF0234 family)
MPSFDIVNKIDLQEVDNAVNTARKQLANRYDFKDSNTEIELNKKDGKISIVTGDDMKMRAVQETLTGALFKRGVDSKALEYGVSTPTGKGMVKREAKLVQGIDSDTARKIVKIIKDLQLKVQTQIQDDQVRVTAKKIDDLQAVIAVLKQQNLTVPLQYVNMKS